MRETSVGCVADTHCSGGLTPESLALYPKYVQMLGQAGEPFFRRMAEETDRAFEACVGSLREGGHDVLVHLGDVTGGWQERGIAHPATRTIAQRTMARLRGIAPVYVCAGNHDTGYSRFGTLEGAETHLESVEACQETLGDLYWTYRTGDMLSVGVCSPIAEYRGAEARLLELQRSQEAFVADALAAHDGPWTLYTHDVRVIRDLGRVLSPHAGRCARIVFGDLHHPVTGRAAQTLYGALHPALRTLFRKAVPCPSVAPLWWGGYRRLEVRYGAAGVTHREIDIARPHDHDRLPSSSALWALAGMARPRLAYALERVGLA